MREPEKRPEFDEFALAAWSTLCRLGFLLTSDRHAAEDLAQTALTRTYVAWRRVRRDDALLYARRTLVNAAIDRHRARTRRAEVLGVDAEKPTDVASTDLVELRDELTTMLAVLTSRERQVLALRYYADLSEPETAHELGVSVGTVKSTASRALAKLRRIATTIETAEHQA